MKKFSFLALAAAGLLTVGCSEKDEEVKDVQAVEEFKDGAFIGLSLQLPTADQGFTRANDDLSNGTADEFAVKNATLYIFNAPSGTTNPDEVAKFVGYVTLGTTYAADKEGPINPDEWGVQTGVDDTNITSTYNEAAQIPNALASEIKTDASNDYYAYVIVNHNGQIPAVEKGTTTFATFSKAQFSSIGADIAAKKNIYESGLLMTSAPICDKSGGSAAPANGAKYTTLVALDKTKIYGNKKDATDNPAGCVYVERAAVKITVEDGRGDSDKKIGDYDVNIDGWQVINYEPTYYNTRQIESAWGEWTSDQKAAGNNKYRFVSLNAFTPTLPLGADHTNGYRTYFAKDVQFDANATLRKTVASTAAADWIAVGKQNHAYTTENTFDVQRQTWRNTTMVTLKVTMSKTEGSSTTSPDFYTVGKGSQTMYATEADAKAAIENIVKNDPAVTTAYNELTAKIAENNPTQTVTPGLTVTFGTTPTTGKTDVPFTIEPSYTIGSTAADYQGTGESTKRDALVAAITAVIDADNTTDGIQTSDAVLVSFYKGGVSYYNARIKHFGEAETPWSATGAYVTGGGTNIKEIYGYDSSLGVDNAANVTANQRFLGRYGVVRDNWYKLSIDKIGKIGSAEPVDPSIVTPDTPDDEIENFISVHVHIVPWVLREQSVQF